MASLLDFLGQSGQGGLLGNIRNPFSQSAVNLNDYIGGTPQQRIDQAFGVLPLSPQQRINQSFEATNASPLAVPSMPPVQDVQQSSQGAMPVSMPTAGGPPPEAAPAAQAAPQNFGQGLNNWLGKPDTASLLMALGGGIAQHGIGGFAAAAPFATNQAKWGVIGTDSLGNQKYGWIDPNNRTITPAGGGVAGATGGGGAIGMQPNYNENGKDEAFLAALRKEDPLLAEDMLRVTEGKMPATGRNLQKIMQLASRYDQGFTGAQDYATRLQAAKSFAAGGKDAEVVKSYNQALTHANAAWNLIPKIEGVNVGGPIGGMINAPYAAGRAAMNPQFASDTKEYKNIINALAGELRKASNGSGHGSLEEIRNWQSGSLAANSGAEMRGALRGAMDFLEGAMEATARKKTEGLKSQFSSASLLDPKNAATFAAIKGSSEGSGLPAASTAAAPAAPAGVVRWEKGPDGRPRPMVQQ